ncbi:(2Fe-2S)-binding protein [Bacillus nitroreducens]
MEKLVICRCEEVTLADIKDTVAKYECSAREVKLRTRAGMGYCGGRMCRTSVDAVLHEIKGEKPGNEIPLNIKPPVRPVSLSSLGGQS